MSGFTVAFILAALAVLFLYFYFAGQSCFPGAVSGVLFVCSFLTTMYFLVPPSFDGGSGG